MRSAGVAAGGRPLRRIGRRALARLEEWPAIRRTRELLYEARFRRGAFHCGYCGVFDSFEEASSLVWDGMAGFDHADMADIGHYTTLSGETEPMPATEYPVLFWLRQALDDGAGTLFDLGGYVGHVYRQYRKYLDFPADFRWTVFDVQSIVEAGQTLALRDAATHMRFATTIDPAQDMDILLAAGSLQYVEEGYLVDVLRARSRLPRHVFVQRTPLHPTRSFVTIQSIVTRSGRVCFCPYTVASRETLLGSLAALGYRLLDSWEKPRRLDVPFHPECGVETYSGLYWRRDDDAA